MSARTQKPSPQEAKAAPGAMKAQPVWSTMFFTRDWPDHGAHAADIAAHFRERRDGGAAAREGVAFAAKSADGLYESPLDLFDTTRHAGLKKLIAWLDDSVRTAVHAVNGAQFPRERLKVLFSDSWFHITNDGGFHDAHYHGNCSWCGIYYLQSGDSAASDAAAGNGVNRFYAPLPVGGLSGDYGNEYLGNNRIDIKPVDGRLILFPSHILHGALPYRGDTDRMVISFNSRTYVTKGP